MNEYVAIPASEARRISDAYSKTHVIILAWDSDHGLMHRTTYGRDEDHKHQAAAGGDIAAAALGADLARSTCYEDFRRPTFTDTPPTAADAGCCCYWERVEGAKPTAGHLELIAGSAWFVWDDGADPVDNLSGRWCIVRPPEVSG